MEVIEIPFGAKDSELKGWEYTIPEGFTAEIKGGKVIVKEKESEDEKIRKHIVKFIDEQYPTHGSLKDEKDKMLAYLEKQKYHFRDSAEMVEPESMDGKVPLHTADKSYKIGYRDGKMDAQESAEWSEEDKKKIGRLRSIVNECASRNYALDVNGDYCEGDYAELDEWLKSLPLNLKRKNEDVAKLCSNEWSEEDKDLLLNTKCIIDEVWHSENTFCYSKEELKEMWNWLDTLWQRVEYPQPKQEWNEGYKEMLNIIIGDVSRTLHSCGIGTDEHLIRSKAINFLKSLYLESYWKPSEEQMEALSDTLAFIPDTFKPKCTLVTLQNDLKKQYGTA